MQKEKNKLYFFVNLFFTASLFIVFVFFNEAYRRFDLVFTLLALLSTIATVYLIYFILARPFFNLKYTHLVLALLFTLTNMTVLADAALYRIWKFHINGMVLNILFSPAAYDSLYLTPGVIGIIAAVVLFLCLFQYVAYRRSAAVGETALRRINGTFLRYAVPLLFAVIAFEKITYAVANLHQNAYVLERVKVIPLYQPLLMDDLLVDVFGMTKVKAKTIGVKIDTISNVRYPRKPVELRHPQTPNIFIFGFDGLRPDVVSDEVTPNLNAFAQSNLFFGNNKSGGNNTRFGLFTLFYGINSSYWFNFLNAQKGPVLFDVLRRLRYRMAIISGVNLAWPEFRKTIFVDVQETIRDDFKGAALARDEQAAETFLSWIDEQNASRPLFAFVWLDGIHAKAYDGRFRKFLPDNGGNDYLTVERKDSGKQFNRYKNAAYCVDDKFGRFIEKLKAKKLYDDAIVIVVSDHGQEFYEYGSYGHNSAYDAVQVNAALIVHWPGKRAKVVREQTSSMDVVPTLLKTLGVSNDVSDYAQGMDLFDPHYKRTCSFLGNWNENAIVCDDYTVIMPDIIAKLTEVRVTDSYETAGDFDAAEINGRILKALRENRRFLK